MNTEKLDPSGPGSIERHFTSLTDPRVVGRTSHSLLEIITIAILAVICGADGWDHMEHFAVARQDWLKTLLPLANGVPSDDTFARVFGALNPKEFCKCFSSWMQELVSTTAGKLVAIDGKSLRRSFDRASGKSMLHLVHAWVAENSTLLGQIATEDKSNEITAIPALIDLLDLRGALVTIDAIGCQKSIAEKIVSAGADYALALKDNHPTARAEISKYFDDAVNTPAVTTIETTDAEHGRIEVRKTHVTEQIAWFEDRKQWPELRSFVCVERERTVDAKTTYERALYLCSLPQKDALRIAQGVRAHWSVENALHWTLDVSFREDASRIRKHHGAQNMALLRRTAITLLRRERSVKAGAPTKRLRAGWDNNYLLKVLEAANGLTSGEIR